jgi:hypothetical protein
MAGAGPAATPIGRAEGAGALASSVMLVPGGLEIAAQPQPRPTQNLEREQNTLTDIICGVMGVPNSLIHPASSTYNSGGLVQRIVNAEMNRQARHVAVAFTRAYTHIYAPQPQPQRAGAKAKAEAAAAAQQAPVACYLVYPPFLEVETILAIAAARIYTNEFMGALVAHGAGFYEAGTTEQFVLPEPPPPEQPRAPAQSGADADSAKPEADGPQPKPRKKPSRPNKRALGDT